MANLSYHELREAATLVDYNYQLGAGGGVWVETYHLGGWEYRALFNEHSQLPLTILKHEIS